MSELYENLLKATNNIDDITTEKYATVTKLNGNYCDAKEEDTGLEHTNIPIINGANLSVGDKAIIGFLNNSIYDVVCYGALDKTIHDDSKQDTLISGTNIKTINHQSLLGSGNITIEGGGGGSSNLFDLNTVSQYGDNAIEEGVDKDGTGLGYGNDFLIFNSQDQKFYYDKDGSADNDSGNELATMNDLPTNSSIVDLIYPVGSIYMSVNSTSPQTLFGGTWEQIEDTFLLASGTTYNNGDTGGSADATLVSHNHSVSATGEYFVTSENTGANNTRVSYNASGNRYVDGMTSNSTPFHHREYVSTEGSNATGMNMPPYLVVNVWKRTA